MALKTSRVVPLFLVHFHLGHISRCDASAQVAQWHSKTILEHVAVAFLPRCFLCFHERSLLRPEYQM